MRHSVRLNRTHWEERQPLRLQMPGRDTSLEEHLSYLAWMTPPPTDDAATVDLVRDCLARLHAKDRDLIEARFYECLSYRQIAARFGWPNPQSAHWAVGAAVRRLGKKVRGALHQRGIHPGEH